MTNVFPDHLRYILDLLVAHCNGLVDDKMRTKALARDAYDLNFGRLVARSLSTMGYKLCPIAGMLIWDYLTFALSAGVFMWAIDEGQEHLVLNALADFCINIQSGSGPVLLADNLIIIN
jgi:hypothetical protein